MVEKDEATKMAEMERWLRAVCEDLELDFDALIEPNKHALLRLISSVAHGPSRPGAPMTAFLVGYAAAMREADPSDIARSLDVKAKGWE